MINFIDNLLNKVTMYLLLVYYLVGLLLVAFVFSFDHYGNLSFNYGSLLTSTLVLVIVCYISNEIFGKIFNAPLNRESSIITGLILALIVTPTTTLSGIIFLTLVSVLAMASKFILAYKKVHIFNPAAISVVITGLVSNQTATWWVGTPIMLPFVVIGGLLLVRKIQRGEMVIWFLASSLIATSLLAVMSGDNLITYIHRTIVSSGLCFMAFVMLTEPSSSPRNLNHQRIYGLLAGVLFPPQVHIGSIFSTPQLDLVLSNIYAFLTNSKARIVPKLVERKHISRNVYDFAFKPERKIKYKPGQYMEWTLPHKKTDLRGNRRYFTLASSPTEANVHLGIKFYENSSSFKKSFFNLKPDEKISAAQLGGDFVMPKNKNQKLVFIAGGIGITPFRSMAKYLIDMNEKRDIVLLYGVNSSVDLAYKEIFDEAKKKVGLQPKYILSEPDNDRYLMGPINSTLIKKEISDWEDRTFYISGTHHMVESIKSDLKNIGVSPGKIKVDFFPGYA